MRKIAGPVGAFILVALASAASAQTTPNPTQTAPSVTSDAAATLSALQKVCLPLLRGADVKSVAASAGLKNQDGQWTLSVNGQTPIELEPPDYANPHVCIATITHPPGQNAAILQAVDNWAKSQTPPLQPQKVQQQTTSATHLYTISSWSGQTPQGTEGVVLNDAQPLPGQSAQGGQNETTLLVSVTPA
jgi:hypothetical protein